MSGGFMAKRERLRTHRRARHPSYELNWPSAGTSYGERYPWIASCALDLVPLHLFDARSQTGLRRAQVRTWGDLAKLSDMTLAAIPGVGRLTLGRVNEI